MKTDSVRTILYALAANLAIAAAKTAAAVFTGSSSMLAEAIHSYADSGNQGLLLWGLKQAKRPPSPDYPLGWGKAVFFWSFIVALVLFSLGGLFSLYEGWHKLAKPEPLKYGWVAIGVVLIVVAFLVGIEIKALLIGQSAEPETEARLREVLLQQEGIAKIYRLITLQLGTSLMVAVKAKIKANTAAELVASINRAEAALRTEFPEIQWLFFEPDVAD